MDGKTIELGRTPLRIVQVVALVLVAFKFVHLALAGVFMDEAYYWMWGQHPALSYYDHPPLNAWLLGLSSALLGWNVLALRAPVGLAFLADILAIWLLSRRLANDDWRTHFWVTLLLFVVTPLYWMVSALALPDHMLLTCCLFALYFFISFFGGEGRSRDLYGGAFALGLGGLSKYNAAFLGLAVVIYVLAYRRELLRQPRLWLAGMLTILIQAPVIVWNVTEHFASWDFILQGRHAGLRGSLDGLINLVAGIVIFISPFLFVPIGRFVLERRSIPGIGLARSAFLISTISIFGVSLVTLVLFHWNLVAYAAMLPFLAFFMRPRWLLPLQALWGIAFVGLAFWNYAVAPVVPVSVWKDEATAWSYGWAKAATAVEAAKAAHPVGFIAAADYTTASLLAFALKDKDVVSLSPHRDQYDYWFDPNAHTGEDAILFGDRWRPLPKSITRLFATVTELKSIKVTRRGQHINTQHIYLATGYKPRG